MNFNENIERLYKEWASDFDAINPPSVRAAFTAGYEEAVRWNDINENPDNLPEVGIETGVSQRCIVVCERYYWEYNYDFARYDSKIDKWVDVTGARLEDVVAWQYFTPFNASVLKKEVKS